MKNIQYTIDFFSEWHAGSGLTSGSDIDALVIKDEKGLPFIPGKTLKGLMKEAAMEMIKIKGSEPVDEEFITKIFGYFDDKRSNESEVHTKSKSFFTNAVLSDELYKAVSEDIAAYFYIKRSSTAIDKSGVADKHSLRKIETTIPCQLSASVLNVDEKYVPQLEQCMQWIKRLGQNRNRGLGRCKIQITKTEEVSA